MLELCQSYVKVMLTFCLLQMSRIKCKYKKFQCQETMPKKTMPTKTSAACPLQKEQGLFKSLFTQITARVDTRRAIFSCMKVVHHKQTGRIALRPARGFSQMHADPPQTIKSVNYQKTSAFAAEKLFYHQLQYRQSFTF